jgi:hypothetical protein
MEHNTVNAAMLNLQTITELGRLARESGVSGELLDIIEDEEQKAIRAVERALQRGEI